MTNGDRIRMMSNEELFDEYFCSTECANCEFTRDCKVFWKWNNIDRRERLKGCREMWLKWLGEEEL